MCGICGIVYFKNEPVNETVLMTMMNRLQHRGPDDQGTFIDQNTGLGFRRLSILDLSQLGHQPMFDDTGRYVIIHNGEVYNYIELREELKKKGYRFRSQTDTEVILYSYIEWGKECLPKFNGMWAFVIYDNKEKSMFVSRDRYGIKPFYYYQNQNCFIFASEIPPLLSVLDQRPEADDLAIYDYLVFNRTDQTDMTFFKDIRKLQHGHLLEIKNNRIKISRWYNLRDRPHAPFENIDEYRETLSSAVGLRLRSDVPVGVCFSGGLDSSSIVSLLLNDYNKKDLNTFSAVYGAGKTGDESDYIMEYRDQLANMYFTTPAADTLFQDIKRFTTAHGEPVPSTSPYAQFKVMELAANHVVVTLDGQGADEELAGYHYFYGLFFKDLWRHLHLSTLGSEIYHYLRIHKSLYGLKSFAYFMIPSRFQTSLLVQQKGYLRNEFAKEHDRDSVIVDNLYASPSLQDALFNHFEYKLEHLLKWEDRNSMWFSLESRVPFLDYRLVEKTLASPREMIIQKGYNKYILRAAMRDTLPDKIRWRRDKIGFDTPQEDWFRTEQFKIYLSDLLNSVSFQQRGYIDTEKAKKLYKNHVENKINIGKEIWKWINLEMWFQTYIDQYL